MKTSDTIYEWRERERERERERAEDLLRNTEQDKSNASPLKL